MKKIITLFALFGIVAFSTNAAVFTVSNDPMIPAQFIQITTAIAAAGSGDTILVSGSSTYYSDFTLSRPLVIIGPGMNNPYGKGAYVNYVTLQNQSGFSSSGSTISGLIIPAGIYLYGDAGSFLLENITIERCWLDYIIFSRTNVTYRNVTIQNCLLQSAYVNFANAPYENVVLNNNLMDDYYIYGGNGEISNIKILNNVFINRTTNVFSNIKNLALENNIFYKALPQGCVGCAFTNNTAFGSVNNVLPGAGNTGSGNEARDPLLENYPPDAGAFSWTSGYNFHLKAGSGEIGTGIGSTDRGMYGAPSPVLLGTNPSIPQMTDIIFPDNASSVKVGGSLNVNFKAKKQD